MAIISLKKVDDHYSQLVIDGTAIPSEAILVSGHDDSTINTDFVRSRVKAANAFLKQTRRERDERL